MREANWTYSTAPYPVFPRPYTVSSSSHPTLRPDKISYTSRSGSNTLCTLPLQFSKKKKNPLPLLTSRQGRLLRFACSRRKRIVSSPPPQRKRKRARERDGVQRRRRRSRRRGGAPAAGSRGGADRAVAAASHRWRGAPRRRRRTRQVPDAGGAVDGPDPRPLQPHR